MLVFLPFCHLFPDIILFLLSHSLCFLQYFFQEQIPVSPCFYSPYLGCFFSKTKTHLFKFPFSSFSFLSIFFSVLFLLILTLFMFPLLLRTLLIFNLFLLNSFFSKTLCHFFFFQDLCVSFSRLFHFFFSSLSVKTLYFVFSFLFRLFLFLFFSVLFLRIMPHFSHQRNSLPNISQNCFSEVLFVFEKFPKNVLSSSLTFSFFW